MHPDTPVILIENVSLPSERSFATQLNLLPVAALTALGDGPVMMLIGKAMGAVSSANISTHAIGSVTIDLAKAEFLPDAQKT